MLTSRIGPTQELTDPWLKEILQADKVKEQQMKKKWARVALNLRKAAFCVKRQGKAKNKVLDSCMCNY